MPLKESSSVERITEDSGFPALWWKSWGSKSCGLSNCCETPSQVRDEIKNNRILNKNFHLALPLVLLEFEKSSLLRWLFSKGVLMQPASLCTVSCLLYYLPRTFSENNSKVCSPLLNKTYSYRSRWEHKGRENSFQAEMSETSFRLKEGKKK